MPTRDWTATEMQLMNPGRSTVMTVESDPNDLAFSDFHLTPLRYGDNSGGKITCRFHRFKGEDDSQINTLLPRIAATGITTLRPLTGELSWGFYGEFACPASISFSETAMLIIGKLLDALAFSRPEKYRFYHLLKMTRATYVRRPGHHDQWLSYKDHLLIRLGVDGAPPPMAFGETDSYLFP